ncbi:MAG: NUDIX domain-containing protein [Candidatus Heimdallarchaeota archaeon]
MSEEVGQFNFCVAAILENPEGEILLIKRAPDNPPVNVWDVVGGAVEQFEDPFDGLKREIEEETGITDFEIVKALDVFHGLREKPKLDMIGLTFWCKTKTREVVLSDEHVEFKWLKPDNALKISNHQIVTSNLEQYIKEKNMIRIVNSSNGH